MCTFECSTCGRVVLLGYEVLSKEVPDKEWFYWESPLMEVPDMGRVVQLEGGCSTSGRWFLAWVGWFYVCESSVLNVLRGGSTLQGNFDPLKHGSESAELLYDGENGGVFCWSIGN